jgi:hypothetical protein
MRRLLLAATLLLPLAVPAAPDVGSRLPEVKARDVAGNPTRLRSLLDDNTLIVAITDRDGAGAMRAWFERAHQAAPDAAEVSIVSLDLPFFVSDGYARSKAREEVPKEQWRHSLLDKDGKLAKDLALPEGKTPFVMVVDGEGKVLARFHGAVTAPGADAVWKALSR